MPRDIHRTSERKVLFDESDSVPFGMQNVMKIYVESIRVEVSV